MTKEEAIKEMLKGNKVTHKNFDMYKWMKLNYEKRKYELEDGVLCPADEFWKWRQGPAWEDNWSLYKEEIKEGTIIEFKSGEQFEIVKIFNQSQVDLKATVPYFTWMPDYYPIYYSIEIKDYKIIVQPV